MRTVGFLTSADLRELWTDDHLALPALRDEGIDVRPVVWTEAYDPSRFDAIVVRSPWDWFLRPHEFVAHLDALAGARVFNAPSLLRRFIDKSYMLELERRGVPIVPTEWLDIATGQKLDEIVARRGWTRALVKPSVSANAHGASVLDLEAARVWAPPAGHRTFLVQPFLREVLEDGEWTFVFFDGVFSHAVKKTPAAGDFRVQTDHGGAAVRGEPDGALVAQAERAVRALGEAPLYARVDGVVVNGELLLMELEVVEPELFFRFDPQAPVRFARALRRRLEAA